ncbi:hypothetical protein BGX26_003193 [Mortierella sp. AD094]|nr:hypothetical protein BGX26_003193 [Mortierella sp. AD094]
MAPGGFPVGAATPLPLPTTPALFPQNISTCSTCYGMFPTLSRCNCICTYKALDAYPYCIDCFTKTQQLNQLNVLQANHLENYVDAFRQLCGATYNGNKVPVSGTAKRAEMQAQTTVGLISLASIFLTSLFTTM